MSITTGLPPIVWKNSPKFGCMIQGTRGRAGQKVLGWVMHHIVGTLPVADTIFLDPKQKLASSHFGIGYVDGRLEIHQYVDVSDTAWCNGDASEPSWSVTKARPGVNPNLYTISTEHEDGGSANRGRVSAAVWAASIALVKLCTSGDPAAIRAAGIRVRDDATVKQLAAIPKNATGFVDHHQIAGPKKPYCWRPWLDDPGFVNGSPSRRDQLLAALNRTEDVPMPLLRRKFEPWIFKAGEQVYAGPSFDAEVVTTLVGGPGVTIAEQATYDEHGNLVSTGDWRILVLSNDQAVWVHRSSGDPLIRGGAVAYDALVKAVLIESDVDAATGRVTPPHELTDTAVQAATHELSEHVTALQDAINQRDAVIAKYPK